MPTCKNRGCHRSKDVADGGFCSKCMEISNITLCGHCKDKVQTNQKGMSCERCEVWFHISCVNINATLYDLLVKEDCEDDGFRWFCPTCRGKSAEGTSENVKAVIQSEIKNTLPDIVKTVLTESNQCAEILSKTYADIVKKQQNNMINETVKATSNMALKESMISLESNLAEKKRRSRNVIITGVPEGEEEVTEDIVYNTLKPFEARLNKNEILAASRLGRRNENSETDQSRRPRMIIVTLKFESDATSFHNNGIGRKIEDSNIWVNPDLTRTERDVLYRKRVQRRRSKAANIDKREAGDPTSRLSRLAKKD